MYIGINIHIYIYSLLDRVRGEMKMSIYVYAYM